MATRDHTVSGVEITPAPRTLTQRHLVGLARQPLHGGAAQRRLPVKTHHGSADRRPVETARRRPTLHHLRPRHGVLGLVATERRHGYRQLVQRPASAVAEGHRGEHEQSPSKRPASHERSNNPDPEAAEDHLPEAEWHAQEEPRLPDPRRILREPPAEDQERVE